MKKIVLAGGIALSLIASSLFAADKPLRLGIEAAYPPFAYKEASGQIAGFDVDIGNALCAEMKAEYPVLYERMNTARNLAWLPRVKAMLDAL